jgi:hypothetical protein
MPDTNTRLILREDLTDYAFGVLGDYEGTLVETRRIAPVVPVGVFGGRYLKLNTKQDFVAPNTKRVAGGETATAKWGGEMADFQLDNNALKMPIDVEIELPQAGANGNVIEKSKVHTLLSQAVQALAADVYGALGGAVSEHATFGKFSDATVDPIDQIDAAAIEIYEATGMYPNFAEVTPQAWRMLKNNPKTRSRFPGKVAKLTLDDCAGEMSGDIQFVRSKAAGLVGGGFGNAAATFQPLLGVGVWLYYANPLANGVNPSWACTLSYSPELLDGVYEYMSEDGTMRYLRIKWATKTVVQSTALCRRIAVS